MPSSRRGEALLIAQTRIWLFAYILNINIQLFLIVNYNYFISVF